MKYVKLILLIVVTAGFGHLLNNRLTIGSTSLPPLGKFLSPYTGYFQNTESNPGSDKTILFDNLSSTIKVVFDERLVPHIYAKSLSDAFYAQGYIQAKYRLWQMDITTRAAGGMLAEIMGPQLLERDKLQRRLGMLWSAEKMRDAWNADLHSKELIAAFCKGVNHYIKELSPRDYPIEFKLLDYAPSEYSPLQIALYIKSMAQRLNSRESDVEMSNTKKWLGNEDFNHLFPNINPADQPVIPAGPHNEFQSLPAPVRIIPDPEIGYLPTSDLPKSKEFVGSNNWAINSSKSTTGHPILCNDPHLGLTLPSVWFEVAIHTPEMKARGVTLPGTPGIIIGFNHDVAWGVTNVGHDVADWYLVRWTDDRKLHYMYDGGEKEITTRIEKFRVKGGGEVYDTVKYTFWGPVVYEQDGHPHQDLAYRWITHDQGNENELYAFIALSEATNYEDYYRALRWFHAPAQNFVFASKTGDIALRVTGKFPIRAEEQGRFIQDGSLPQNRWAGFIPYEQIPGIKNPQSGYVASANQRSVDTIYPYHILGGFEDYRGRTINKFLDSLTNMDLETMKSLQNSNFNLMAAECAPILVNSVLDHELNDDRLNFVRPIQHWNYYYDADLIEPVMFDLWFNNLYDLIWDEFLEMSDSVGIVFPEIWRTVNLIKHQPKDPFFDVQATLEREDADILIFRALNQAMKDLDSLKQKGVDTWTDYNGLRINHLANLPGFNSEPIHTGGHPRALNAINGQSSHGPSWRMIVSLEDKPYGLGVYPGGQSGNPGSSHFDQFISTWAEGKYYPLHLKNSDDWNAEQVLFTLEFKPGK